MRNKKREEGRRKEEEGEEEKKKKKIRRRISAPCRKLKTGCSAGSLATFFIN